MENCSPDITHLLVGVRDVKETAPDVYQEQMQEIIEELYKATEKSGRASVLAQKPILSNIEAASFFISLVRDAQLSETEFDTILCAWALLDGYQNFKNPTSRRRNYLKEREEYIPTYIFGLPYADRDVNQRKSMADGLRGKEKEICVKISQYFQSIPNVIEYIKKASQENFAEKLDSDGAMRLNYPAPFYKSSYVLAQKESSDWSWGDNSSDKRGYSRRPTYTTAEIESGILGERTALLNSIFDGTADERKFVSVCESSAVASGQNANWQNVIDVEDGKVYTVRMYVHNDSLNGYRSIAENTRIKYTLPTEISNEQEIRGYIASSNTSPSECWSSVYLKSPTNVFSLKYVKGSCTLQNAATGSHGCQLTHFRNDSYTMIGYKYLDGEFPGGNQYACFITIQVRVVFEAQCKIKTTQRICNSPDKSWYRTTEAEIGDIVECQFYYKNTSKTLQENLMIRYVLPNNLEYISDSTVLYNSNYQTGVGLNDNTVTTSGINIGHYQPNGNAYVRFKVRVVDNNLFNGMNCLINWGAATVEGKVAKDNAQLYVIK